MAESNQKQWIILLNKSPRGPFSQDEISELIKQGILRHIDLAFLVPEKPGETQAVWKFIWQFSEFDSRRHEKESPPPAAVLEKRTPKTEDQVVTQIQEIVPLDLQSITVDDLILRANSAPRREVSFSSSGEEKEQGRSFKSFERGQKSNTGGLAALFSVLALVGILYASFKGGPANDSSKEPSRGVAQDAKGSGSSTVLGVPKARSEADLRNKKPFPPAPPIAAPRERDRGEIREEELLRIREDERRQEAAARERERQREEESNKEEEEDSVKEPSKREKRRRKTAAQEPEEGSEEDSSSNPEPNNEDQESSSSSLE